MRGNPDPVSRLADETGDSIAEHSDDESITNAPDTPDVGNVSDSIDSPRIPCLGRPLTL